MILLSLSFAAAADIQRRIYFFTQQSNYLRQACYTQRGDFLNDTVLFDPASSIAETTIDCNAQAVALNQELDAIQTEVQRLGGDNCELEIVDDSLIDLLNGGTGIADEMNCPGIGSAGQCAAVMGCNLMSGIIPFGGRIAQMALRNHPTLNQCAASGTNCFENIGAAIGHNLFDTLSGLCYLATFGYACGPDEEPDPDGESRNRALAAQSQDDESVASFSSDPIGWLYNMGNSILDMITQAITERYGCRQWTGAPFVSGAGMPVG